MPCREKQTCTRIRPVTGCKSVDRREARFLTFVGSRLIFLKRVLELGNKGFPFLYFCVLFSSAVKEESVPDCFMKKNKKIRLLEVRFK